MCPISVINTTNEEVEVTTPSVELEDAPVTGEADVLTLHTVKTKQIEHILHKRAELRQQLRTEHLNFPRGKESIARNLR